MTIIAPTAATASLTELLHKAAFTRLQDDERDVLRCFLDDAVGSLTELETLAVSESIAGWQPDMCRAMILNALAARLTKPAETHPVLVTLAAYAIERPGESERSMLLAAILTISHGVTDGAVELALYGGRTSAEYDQLKAAGDERERLLEQARRQAQAAEYEPQPTAAEQAVAA